MTSRAPVQATFFDGVSAQRHAVLVTVAEDGKALVIAQQHPHSAWVWPLAQLRVLSDHAQTDSLTLSLHADHEDESLRTAARLVLCEPEMIKFLQESAPFLHKNDIKQGTAAKIIWRLGLAVVAVVVLLFGVLPRLADVLANHLPLATEVAFGQTVITQMERVLGGRDGNLACGDPEGEAALNRLASRLLDGQALAYPIRLSVFDHEMVNAFAAPGGQIVILRGLLETADSAEEVAAVLAHEIGHVESRDPTCLLLRAAGSAGVVSLILGDVTGGTMFALVGEQLLQSAYTRKAEVGADDYALQMLQAARVDAAAFGDFFEKLQKSERGFGLPEYLSSHPSSAETARRARAFAAGQGQVAPVLTQAEWRALKRICKS
jgi:beta-barrel assembly-enhancing protease